MEPYAMLMIQWLCGADDCPGGDVTEEDGTVTCNGCGRTYWHDGTSDYAELDDDQDDDQDDGAATGTPPSPVRVNPAYL